MGFPWMFDEKSIEVDEVSYILVFCASFPYSHIISRFSVYHPIFPHYIHIIPMLYPCYTHIISSFFITVRRSLQVEDEGGDWH